VSEFEDEIQNALEPLRSVRDNLTNRLNEIDLERSEALNQLKRINKLLQVAGIEPAPVRTRRTNGKPLTANPELMKTIAQVLKMSDRPLTVEDLVAQTGRSQSPIQKTIQVMRAEGVIRLTGTRPRKGARHGKGANLYDIYRDESQS